MKKTRFKHLTCFALFVVVIACFMVLVTETAEGRAGGGHRYPGGGGSSSSGGGGGGDGELIALIVRILLYLIIHHPFIGIPLAIVVAVIAYIFYDQSSEAYVDYTINKGGVARQRAHSRVTLNEIKIRDPNFDEAVFLQRVRKGFNIIQQAWTERETTKAQAFLSDGIYERFTMQLGELKDKGIIDHLESMTISSVKPVNFQSDKNFDAVYVMISAVAVNYRKDEKTGRFIDGSRSPEPFAEVWTFVRKPGAQTQKKPGLIEGQCPNCGNPVKLGRAMQCDICNSFLRSGEYDWVLTEITQAGEWAPRSAKDIPGWEEMTAIDPDFNVQHIEDKVSVMFWRLAETERKGKIDILRKVAKDEFCDLIARTIKPDSNGMRRLFSNCGVGSVELIGISVKEPEDKLFVEIAWSGYPTIIRNGKEQVAAAPVLKRDVFALVRRHGAKTKLESSLASSHCPSCGAPEQTGVENECSYCGSVMNDGVREWVLEKIISRHDPEVRAIISKRKTSPVVAKSQGLAAASLLTTGLPAKAPESRISTMELMRWTIAMMLADGIVDDREMELLSQMARERNISNTKMEEMINMMKSQADPVAFALETGNIEDPKELMKLLARMALSDGRLSSEELEMLKSVGRTMGYANIDIEMLVNRERRNMYQEAKAAIRSNKRAQKS